MRPVISTAVLAHQGGWDEILLVAGPIVVIIVVLAIAKHRVDAQVAAAQEGGRADDRGVRGAPTGDDA